MEQSIRDRPSAVRPRGARVHVLDIVEDLGSGIEPASELLLARERAVARTLTLGEDARGYAEGELQRAEHGVLVCEGFLLREVTIEERAVAELAGPGDVLLWGESPGELLPCAVSWTAIGSTRVAMLDADFALRAAGWPGILAGLLRRAGERSTRASVQRAMLAVPNVELRVLLFLWHYATRWGRVRPDGVLVPVALTHEVLGRLVGARRPTVTTAVGRLRERGAIAQRQDRTWLLRARSAAELAHRAFPAGIPGAGAASLVGAHAPGESAPSALALSRRLAEQRLRLMRMREHHENQLATMLDRADVLRTRAGDLRREIALAQANRRGER